jgi:GR25 family glycosyltransferase involved in LPS biosynthesis
MRVFVINAYEDRKEKYDEEKYEIFPAIHWTDVTEEQVEEYHFRHNARLEYRKKVVACSLSHQAVLGKIINENLKDVFILEDDAIIEKWDRLKELEGCKEFCYIGGQINAPLMKDFKKFEDIKDSVRDNFCKGINVIDPKEFRLAHACAYFIPNRRVAQDILSNIPNGKKERAIDTEYISLQKKGKITKFVYPAIATLYLEDACKGFTYSTYKLLDDQWLY